MLTTPPGDRSWWAAIESFALDAYCLRSLPQVEDHVVVDIGANIGAFTLAVCERYPHTRGVAVEPAPRTFAQLRSNLARNTGADSITAIQAAASPNNEPVIIYQPIGDSTRSSIRAENAGDRAVALSVPSLTLHELLSPFDHVDFMKIDIEGAEYAIQQDIIRAVSRGNITRLVIEYHPADDPGSSAQLLTDLSKAGMTLMRHERSSTPGVGVAFFSPATT